MSTGVPNIAPSNPAPSAPNQSTTADDDTNQSPSQLRGHTKWAKGLANEAIGNLTSFPTWQASSASDKAEGTGMMHAAKERVDEHTQQNLYPHRGSGTLKAEGQTEGALGKVLGCAGMQERGIEKVEVAEMKRNGAGGLGSVST